MVKNYFKAVRILNLALLSFIFWGLMLHCYSVDFNFELNHFLLFLSILLTTASGYLINNFYDIESDRINEKLVNDLSAHNLIRLYFIHLILSFIILFTSSLSAGWILMVMICHVLVFSYSLLFQKIPLIGNVLVSFLCFIVVVIPQLLIPDYFYFKNFNINDNLIITYSVFCFIITLKREIIKDIEDQNGDQKTGNYTIPIILGLKFTKVLISVLVIIELIFMYLVLKQNFLDFKNLFFAFPQIIVLIMASLFLYKYSENKQFKKLSNLVKVQFLIAGIWLYITL